MDYVVGHCYPGYAKGEGVFEFEVIGEDDGLYEIRLEDGTEDFHEKDVLNTWSKEYEGYLSDG